MAGSSIGFARPFAAHVVAPAKRRQPTILKSIVCRRFFRCAGDFPAARLPPCPLSDSARLRRPSAPPVRSAKPPQGPGGYALSTLTRFCSAHPAATGLRSAPAALGFRSRFRPASGPLRSPDSPEWTPAASGALQPHQFAPQKPPQGSCEYALHLDPVFAPPTPPPPASGRLRRLPKTPSAFFSFLFPEGGAVCPRWESNKPPLLPETSLGGGRCVNRSAIPPRRTLESGCGTNNPRKRSIEK